MKTATRPICAIILFILLAFIGNAQEKPAGDEARKHIFETFNNASRAYMAKNLQEAIPLYKAVYDAEIKAPVLPRLYWYVLVDCLGMAYGMTGQMESAEKIFLYGIANDPEYPLFHFNMACVYAERNDLDRCLKHLENAYKYHKNTMPNETFPDPLTDDSFTGLLKNEKFTSRINELKTTAAKDTGTPGLTGRVFSDHMYRYTVTVPEKWDVEIPKEQYHVVRFKYIGMKAPEKQSLAKFNIMSMDGSGDHTLKQIAEEGFSVIKMIDPDYSIQRAEEIVLQGQKCYVTEIIYANKLKNGQKLHQIDYTLAKNGIAYVFTFTGDDVFYQTHKKEITDFLDSFKFTWLN